MKPNCKFQLSLLVAFIISYTQLNAQNSDFILGGANSWILHTPDDGRSSFFMTSGSNGGNWNWNLPIEFTSTGTVKIPRDQILGGQNSWIFHTPDDGRTTLFIAPGSSGDNWNWASSTQFLNNGSVVIGATAATPAGYKLYVQQGILTEKVKVAVANSGNWADHVFHKNYKLPTLSEVEKFIQQHQHLPNIPSAEEMVKEGNDLGATDARLLAKIEELTLYLIEQQKQILDLQQQVKILSKTKK